MKQRLAIARGMAMEPDILLMDEPFAALDALTRRKMQDDLMQLWEDTRAELNSDGTVAEDASGSRLSDRIHQMLFAMPGAIEEAPAHV